MTLLAQQSYGVSQDGQHVYIHVDNSSISMSWYRAIVASVALPVMARRALEWRDLTRDIRAGKITPGDAQKAGAKARASVRSTFADGLEVTTREQDVLFKWKGGELAVTPEVAVQLSPWLRNSGNELRDIQMPDAFARISVADLSMKHEHEELHQKRRSAGSAFRR